MTSEESKPAPGQRSSKNTGSLHDKDIETHTEIGQAIGAKLRKLYSGVVEQPVPDRFAELLQKLEGSGKKESQ